MLFGTQMHQHYEIRVNCRFAENAGLLQPCGRLFHDVQGICRAQAKYLVSTTTIMLHRRVLLTHPTLCSAGYRHLHCKHCHKQIRLTGQMSCMCQLLYAAKLPFG